MITEKDYINIENIGSRFMEIVSHQNGTSYKLIITHQTTSTFLVMGATWEWQTTLPLT